MASVEALHHGEEGNPPVHHVAMVVADLDAAVAKYQALGFSGADRFTITEQGVEMVTLRSGSAWLEIIRPIDPEGAIARFLAKRGEGVHHVAYGTPNIEQSLAALAAAGVRLIDSEPRTGAHGWRIAFIHPESCGGVLTELVQL